MEVEKQIEGLVALTSVYRRKTSMRVKGGNTQKTKTKKRGTKNERSK